MCGAESNHAAQQRPTRTITVATDSSHNRSPALENTPVLTVMSTSAAVFTLRILWSVFTWIFLDLFMDVDSKGTPSYPLAASSGDGESWKQDRLYLCFFAGLSMGFIRTSRSATKYPKLCFNSLSAYASTPAPCPRQRPVHVDHDYEDVRHQRYGSSATPAMKDCMETLGDSVSEIQESLTTIKRFRISNIQTWVSAASQMTTPAAHVVKVAQLTINALALVDGLASSMSSP
ncbi:hypothetical protein MUK42_21353 [Musa troglodytarum]|uniref:Pectinesterase inhibitor domain-containing protein n=1 Tax=Musa troglodytarum TaxID=320322 RepID=A0A9E7K2W7_9LILI|nr:hypothetical protein MUK42_21353 [Musa troglodytarum]